ncbi:MAG: PAS domain-containing protein [Burkholderiales bacterium]|nr:PAS domain-containing protein [Burkholderiales bacterium]
MKKSANLVRLLVEILCIVGLTEVLVMLALPALVPGLTGLGEGLVDVALLVLVAGPLIYLRSLAALRQAAARSSSISPSPHQRMQVRTAVALAIGIQVVGLVLTGIGMSWLKHYIDTAGQTRFDRGAEHIESEIVRRFNHPLLGLKGARGAFAMREGFDRSAFRAYVDSHNLPIEFPGVLGFGYIERVARADLQAFVDVERADGAPDFAVKTQGHAPDLFVIKYIEPLAANRPALGFDVGQEAVRREAAERAVATGQPALTGTIALVQSGVHSKGFLYFLPVYRRAATAANGRSDTLAGLLYAPFTAVDLLQGVIPANDPLFDFELFEGDGTRAEQLIYDADGQLRSVAAGATPVHPRPASLQALRTVAVGGRTMALRIQSTPAFAAAQDHSSVAIAGVGGAACSFILALVGWLLAVGRLRAQRMAERITSDLDRMARVVQHTNNAVTLMDAQGRITWVNGGFTHLTGYSAEEALGKAPGELLGSGKADAGVLQTLVHSLETGTACRVEILNRAKDGREYWVDTEVQPTHDAQGVLQGFMEIGTDITLQKRTRQRLETAIRDSAALLTTLEVHAITSTANRAGKITEVNDAFCDISGYSREELLGQDHRIVNSGVHPPAFWEDMWDTISSGSSWRGDICNRRKDGRLYWVDSMIAPFIGDDGTVEKYVSIRTDITASKADQMRMLEMSDRLALAIDGGSDGLWDWMDVSDGAQWWSPSYYRLLGYTPEELPANVESFISILHPDHVQRCREATEWAVNKGKDYDEETLIRTKAHGYRWFRTRAKVYRNDDGKAVRMAGSAQDIHDRKLAQASVVKTSQRFAIAADSAKIGVWEWDLQTNALTWDARMYALFQRTASVANTPLAVLGEALHPDDKARFDAALQESALNGRPFEGDYRIVWPDGEVRHVRSAARVVRDGSGRVARLTGVNFDITEVKRSEEALSHAVTAAEDASRSKSQFVANMSHEIRTPMNAILGMLKLLQNTELTVRQSDYVTKTEGAARSLLGLLNDILDFSKVEAGKMTLDPRVFCVDNLLRDLSVILSANVGSKDIELLFDIDPALPPYLVGDDMRLQQVLINLGGNAIKFTSVGKVVLRLRVVERTDAQVLVEFAMQDSGIGIAPENQAHIFSGFSQAEASTTRRFGGTGLGLAISSRLVGLLGGALALNSVLGQGSTFHFRVAFAVAPAPLPDAPLRDPHAPQPGAAKARRLAGLRLLVVEDNKINQMVAQGLLSAEGSEVTLADDGQLGVDAVLRTVPAFDVVLMDLQMPVMDGYEATRAIRQQPGLATLPIIAMTANAMASDRAACLAAGMSDHVGKPFELDQLVALVLRHSGRAPQPATGGAQSPDAPSAAKTAPQYPPGDLDVQGALERMGHNTTMFETVLRTFVRDLRHMPAQLKSYLLQGQRADGARVLHTLKGLASTVGARHLAAVARQLEARCQPMAAGMGGADVEALMQTLQTAIDASLQTLQPELERRTPIDAAIAAPGAGDHEKNGAQLVADLHTLRALLAQSDMQAMELHAQFCSAHGAALGAALDDLNSAMAALDFDMAAQHCTALLQTYPDTLAAQRGCAGATA